MVFIRTKIRKYGRPQFYLVKCIRIPGIGPRQKILKYLRMGFVEKLLDDDSEAKEQMRAWATEGKEDARERTYFSLIEP